MTTVTLQKLAANKLKMSSHQTMHVRNHLQSCSLELVICYNNISCITLQSLKVAETLYTKGYLSYPRTETDSFAQGTDFRSLINEQTADHNWGNYAQR